MPQCLARCPGANDCPVNPEGKHACSRDTERYGTHIEHMCRCNKKWKLVIPLERKAFERGTEERSAVAPGFKPE